MNEQQMTEALVAMVFGDEPETDVAFAEVQSFAEAGVLTNNEGFVVRMEDGSEFQVTVVQSR